LQLKDAHCAFLARHDDVSLPFREGTGVGFYFIDLDVLKQLSLNGEVRPCGRIRAESAYEIMYLLRRHPVKMNLAVFFEDLWRRT
jgi:hypothetical protein